MTKETITVSYAGKYGPAVDGVFYNIDQKSGLKPTQFEKGKTYSVLVSVSKTGKKYIQQIVGEDAASSAPVEKPGDDKILHAPDIAEAIGKPTTYPKRDFDAEARGKISCALRAALYSSPAVAMYCTSYEEWQKKIDEEVKRGSAKVLEDQRG